MSIYDHQELCEKVAAAEERTQVTDRNDHISGGPRSFPLNAHSSYRSSSRIEILNNSFTDNQQ
jgi:hypothetical protein